MKRVTFFVLLFLLSTKSYNQNLAINPDFSLWDDLAKPTGWTMAQRCDQESGEIRSGTFSCRHTGGTTSTSYLGQSISVLPGKSYTLSVFYKTGIPTSGNGARVWCYWKDGAGANITDPLTDPSMRNTKYFKSDTWEQITFTVTAPALAASFYLEVRTMSNSLTYWDDFTFEETVLTANYETKGPVVDIFPNPASHYLFLKTYEKLQNYEILNIKGETIISSGPFDESEIMIPVSQLKEGMYFIRLNFQGKIIVRKFIRK